MRLVSLHALNQTLTSASQPGFSVQGHGQGSCYSYCTSCIQRIGSCFVLQPLPRRRRLGLSSFSPSCVSVRRIVNFIESSAQCGVTVTLQVEPLQVTVS